jgi:hypothetical protein
MLLKRLFVGVCTLAILVSGAMAAETIKIEWIGPLSGWVQQAGRRSCVAPNSPSIMSMRKAASTVARNRHWL